MRRSWIALACAVVVATCSSCGANGDGRSGGHPVMGTTDQITNLDPAGAYDQGSWIVYGNTFQTLLSFPPGSDQPEPDAASECHFTKGSATIYTCTLRSGLKFSNGDPLTTTDVAFSFNRIKKINAPEGPESLLSNIASVSAAGNQVTFHLAEPDATFPMKISTGAASIVDHKVYRADKLLGGNKLVGSGVYVLKDYKKGKTVELAPDPNYKGSAHLVNAGATIRYYDTPQELAAALKKKDVDFVPRDLPPNVENQYENGVGSYQTIEASDPLTHMLVFDTTHAPFNNPATRRAVADLVNREALARDVYARTVTPVYSLIPQGILGHNTAFFDKYGEDPDLAHATAALHAAGIHTPVKFTITVSSGVAAIPEGDELAKELNASGLFSVTVKHLPFGTFVGGWASNKYDAFTISWSLDYPDPDDFVEPLLGADNVFHDGYHSPVIESLLKQSRTMASRPKTTALFGQIQDQEAADVPILPLWQSKDYAVNAADVHGSSLSLSAAGITCLWLIGVGGNGS
jgi:peptide/nickel transport system substrate-binding protein